MNISVLRQYIAFAQQFGGARHPSYLYNTVVKNCEKYEREGTSLNLNKKRSGRRRPTRSQRNIAAVRQPFTVSNHPLM